MYRLARAGQQAARAIRQKPPITRCQPHRHERMGAAIMVSDRGKGHPRQQRENPPAPRHLMHPTTVATRMKTRHARRLRPGRSLKSAFARCAKTMPHGLGLSRGINPLVPAVPFPGPPAPVRSKPGATLSDLVLRPFSSTFTGRSIAVTVISDQPPRGGCKDRKRLWIH